MKGLVLLVAFFIGATSFPSVYKRKKKLSAKVDGSLVSEVYTLEVEKFNTISDCIVGSLATLLGMIISRDPSFAFLVGLSCAIGHSYSPAQDKERRAFLIFLSSLVTSLIFYGRWDTVICVLSISCLALMLTREKEGCRIFASLAAPFIIFSSRVSPWLTMFSLVGALFMLSVHSEYVRKLLKERRIK